MDGSPHSGTIAELLTSPAGDTAIQEALQYALKALELGKGRFDTQGLFQSTALTFGEPIELASEAHKFVRRSLTEVVAYNQGLSFLIKNLEDREIVPGLQDDPDYAKLFKEPHWNRSKSLLNAHYKRQVGAGNGKMTLSKFTSVALKDEVRNRQSIRDNEAPIFQRFALWSMEHKSRGACDFYAGPLLVMFTENVLTPFLLRNGPDGETAR